MSSTNNPERNNNIAMPRRSFFARILGGAALGLSAMAPNAWAEAGTDEENDGPDWPGQLKGRHHQLIDAYEANKGAALQFAGHFIETRKNSAAVIVIRFHALPLAMSHFMWKKYSLGKFLVLRDPETGEAAVKNPYYQPKEGMLPNDSFAIDRLLANGVVFGVCGLALQSYARRFAATASMSAEESLKEWMGNVIPGITVLPSGAWGVNRAQEAGCTYCSGGG